MHVLWPLTEASKSKVTAMTAGAIPTLLLFKLCHFMQKALEFRLLHRICCCITQGWQLRERFCCSRGRGSEVDVHVGVAGIHQ